jgi:hypothetical protein
VNNDQVMMTDAGFVAMMLRMTGQAEAAPEGCVVTSAGRRYHRPDCGTFFPYSKITPLTTLLVRRPNMHSGVMEDAVLAPCKVCKP